MSENKGKIDIQLEVKKYLDENSVIILELEYIKKNNPYLFNMYHRQSSLLKSYLELPCNDKNIKKMLEKDLKQYKYLLEMCIEYLKRHGFYK